MVRLLRTLPSARRAAALISVALAAAAASACSSAATPEEIDVAADQVLVPVAVEVDADIRSAVGIAEELSVPQIPAGEALGMPEVTVVRDGVALSGPDAGSTRAIELDKSAALAIGESVEVGSSGTAVLRWPEGVRAEVLGGANLTVGSTQDGLRHAMVTQTGGTARYSLPSLENPAALSINTEAGTLLTVGGPADLIVGVRLSGAIAPDSHSDGAAEGDSASPTVHSESPAANSQSPDAHSQSPDPASPLGSAPSTANVVWVIVVQGEVAIVGDAAVASVDSAAVAAPRALAVLGAAEAVVIGGNGDIAPLVLPVDVVSVETWYGQVLSGYADTPIIDAAFRCRLATDATVLRDAPTLAGQRDRVASGAGMPLSAGLLIDAKERTADGLWVKVIASDTGSVGWLRADELECIAPVAGLPAVDDLALALAPITPTPAFAPIAATISFTADDLKLSVGDCAMLRWDVPVGVDVAFDGRSVPGKGWQRVCPEITRNYTLRWIDASGKQQDRTITVEVLESAALPSGQVAANVGSQSGGSSASGPIPTPTPCPEDCIVEMPTMAPTPTIPPRPTRAPTEAPVPTSPPAPTDPPPPAEPTSPPPSEPTDPPGDPTEPPPPVPTDPPAVGMLGSGVSVGGRVSRTRIETGADFAVQPVASRACASMDFMPVPAASHVATHGGEVASPILAVPMKKSTCIRSSSGSEASASMTISSPMTNSSPSEGLTIETTGADPGGAGRVPFTAVAVLATLQ